MEYRAVKQRCAVDLVRLSLPISEEAALNILQSKGFVALDIDLIALARTCIKRSGYRRGAQASEAPSVVDCSSFIKWLYGERGIWLPRRTIQQRNLGEAVDLDHLCAGDVVFTSGRINYYETDPLNGVDFFLQFLDTHFSEPHAVSAFKRKWLGYDSNRENPLFFGSASHNWRCTCSCATAHPASNKDEVSAFDHILDF
jgi:hypothetical protein